MPAADPGDPNLDLLDVLVGVDVGLFELGVLELVRSIWKDSLVEYALFQESGEFPARHRGLLTPVVKKCVPKAAAGAKLTVVGLSQSVSGGLESQLAQLVNHMTVVTAEM